MACNLKMFEGILGLIVIVFGYWQTAYSQWITILAGVALLIHALTCKKHK